MSEARAKNQVSGLLTGPNPGTLLPFHDPDFIAPTHVDLRAITQQHALTGTAVARITGVLPRTVRKWLAPAEVANHTQIPYAAWRLLLIEIGVVEATPPPCRRLDDSQ
jgi:hypothetical protein